MNCCLRRIRPPFVSRSCALQNEVFRFYIIKNPRCLIYFACVEDQMLSVDNVSPRFGEMDGSTTNVMEFPKVPSLVENEEWTYTMRRTMQEIVPGLFLGPYSAAMRSKLEILLNHGITHIVCVRQDIEAHFIRPNFPDRFKYLILDIADTVTENIIQHFPKVRQFVDESLASGGKTLIHGNAGISRSAALVLAYIMEKYGLSCNCAFNLVQQRRFCINPNEGFMAQLAEFEPIYKAQRTLQNGQCSTEKVAIRGA